VKRHHYNDRNHTVALTQPDASTVNFRYNVDGIRDQKSSGGVTTEFVVDHNRDYTQVVLEATGTESVLYTYGDDLLSQERNSATNYFHYDGLGSTRALSDSSGSLTDSYDYAAFGEVLAQTGSTENLYQYTGEQFDTDLDQTYLRARYYDQSVGRFTQQDTWMGRNHDPISLHKYLYAQSDPITYIDPTGNFSLSSVGTALNSVASLASIAQTTYSVFQIATGKKELTAKDVGMAIALGITNKVGGKYVSKFAEKYVNSLKSFVKGIGCNSFAENTFITTANGLVEISEIQIGNSVLTFNEKNGKHELRSVIHIISTEEIKKTLTIELSNGEMILSTPGHLIYVEGKWIAAKEIRVGQTLYSLGNEINVTKISSSEHKYRVYNLTVEGNHNYFVGKSGILAHNISPCEKAAKKLAQMVPKTCFGKYKCDQFALEYEQLLLASKVKGKRLCVESTLSKFVGSVRHGNISKNNQHFAVQVGDLVFDNLNPNGILFSTWADDIGINDGIGVKLRTENMTGKRSGCIQ